MPTFGHYECNFCGRDADECLDKMCRGMERILSFGHLSIEYLTYKPY
jgi:hypothetical protein